MEKNTRQSKTQDRIRLFSSGFSQIYPDDLPVGKVIQLIEERGSFQKVAKIKISPNLGSILNAFVIIDDGSTQPHI